MGRSAAEGTMRKAIITLGNLLIAHGVLTLLTLLGMAVFFGLMPHLLPGVPSSSLGPGVTGSLLTPSASPLMGVAGMVLGVAALVAGVLVRKLRHRRVALALSLTGLFVPLTCMMLPSGVIVALGGVVVLSNKSVREAFDRVAAGTPAGWVLAEIAAE